MECIGRLLVMKWSVVFVKSNTSPCFLPFYPNSEEKNLVSLAIWTKGCFFFGNHIVIFVVFGVCEVDISLHNWHRDVQDH